MENAKRPAAHTGVLDAMPSSCSSSVQILDPIPARASGTTPVDTSDSDDDGSCFGGDGGAASAPRWPAAGRIASSFRGQKALDALCKKHGVDTREFAPLPAGGLRACSPPPAGAVCVYADALKAGMRVPLDPFFRDVLSHFGLAPSQLAPNCWRVMAAFLALSRAAGIRTPSVAVFRQFFSLRALKVRGLYCFSSKDTAGGVLFTGLPDPNTFKGWKEGYFFLKSSAPWPCPVLWGEPTKKSATDPMLTSEEKGTVEKLLRVRGAAAIDIRTYLGDDGNVTAAATTPCAPKPPPTSPPRHTTGAKGKMAKRNA